MRSLLILAFLVFTAVFAQAEVVVLKGVYQGKDLYIKNPVSTTGVGFCIFEVVVNGQTTNDEVNSPSFAIDLAAFGYKIGTPLEIILRCKEECEVKVLNPEAIYPNATFEITSITLSPDGLLKWETTKETASIPFIIEQFKWNRWVTVGEVQGSGDSSASYELAVVMHSGTNRFRVSQLDYKGTRYSPEVTAESNSPVVKLTSVKVSKSIEFSSETDYEVYSEFGALVKSGRAKSVDASTFFKGQYYVNFDNQTGIRVDKK